MTADKSDEPADDETFHPLGEAWQDDLEDLLDETEYDTDLGMDMARDAMRVTKGELSEEAFHERYHEEVMEEFGEDERPIASPDDGDDEGGLGAMLSGLGDDESRRDMLKKAGAGAGFVGLSAWGTAETQGGDEAPNMAAEETSESQEPESGTQWGMTIDLEHCDGCLSCVTACNQEHNWDEGANWMYVLAFEDGQVESPEPDEFDSVRDFNYLVRPCQHCTDAPCEKVCPTTARHTRNEDGIVLTDYEVCIGCRYCQVACPYGVNYFQWDEPDVDLDELDQESRYDDRERPVSRRAPRGVMSKCVFDPVRQDGEHGESLVGTTACEQACPPNVIQFGDKNNPASDPQRYQENPSRARTVIQMESQLPSQDELESSLGNDADLDAAIENVNGLSEESIALAKAVEITQEDYEQDPPPGDSLPDKEQTVLDVVSALEEQVNLEAQDALVRLELAEEPGDDEEFQGPDEELAQERFEGFIDGPESEFELLADIGTNPNVTYLGNEPGPDAEQVPGPTSYEDVGMVDRRQEVLDDQTVGFGFRDD
ncbi:4Fe-4S ferredoxin N-terminal domain-containing protein [Natrinema salifodinae]|uniref:Prokaryotic molybdopterin-containing oxidoreductase family, iron-sulfur binding subunit n=1 Tax=Natrinema salifodinae TaxID=1202768 RepID=A0A1I0M7G0_9EURY|nr:4Fe-4S ferredoxin N-terminal domain-containing protein [Natrinema salifodinae]SEV83720.1 prokaryotic molybdopterin-containing oxidoreductase family, iron-sulfur binding subunit [Natrinema salifodinae]